MTAQGPVGKRSQEAWGILWRSENRLDGVDRRLVGVSHHPSRTLLFETRKAARAFIRSRYGYIAKRRDLRAEPHGWRMPIPVRVTISVEVAA